MKYVLEKNELNYEPGNLYYDESSEKIYMIIYDENNHSYALLNIATGKVESKFEKDITSLLHYTYLSDMFPVEQTEPIKLKIFS
ncbi:MAG: hypothetical protein N2043_01475 [Ignavibacterium sp.]|nr:hypothetical protein [Ignavibacterium sp.]